MVCHPLTVQGNFLTNVVGKLANLPKTVKIQEIGYLITALSMDAFQAKVSTDGMQVKEALPYLNASKEMTDSLKLRRAARTIKYQLFSKMVQQAKDLNDEQKKGLLEYLAAQVNAPLVMFDKSPLPATMPDPGPCMIPMGVEVVDDAGKRLVLETQVICLMDIKAGKETIFSVKDAIDNDTLDLVIAHENAHAIMVDAMGKSFAEMKRPSTNGHDTPIITDLGMAYSEGWAEAFEAVYGPANPKLAEKDRKKYNISEFLYSRQDPIRRDRYIWMHVGGKKTGEMKNGLQLMCTEGVIAGQLYDILTSRSINAAFEKCVSTMLLAQPKSYPEFINAFVKIFPDDKKTVRRIVLEGMNYVPVSNDAHKLYQAYYQAKLAYVQKKMSKEEFTKARQAYISFKEDLFAKINDDTNIFANVGPEMWFSGKLIIEEEVAPQKGFFGKMFGNKAKPKEFPFNLDLNTIGRKTLARLGCDEADADKIISAREKTGFFTGDPLKVLAQHLGAEKFAAFKSKCSPTPYVDKTARTPEKASAALWPEDFQHFSQ